MAFTSDPGTRFVGQRSNDSLSVNSGKLILSIFGFQKLIFCHRGEFVVNT